MDDRLVDAIRRRRRIAFVYHERQRLAEPQCYGIGTRGTELLRVHQIEGGGEREPLFDVARITELRILDEGFERPGPHYRRGDSAMRTIYAEL